MTLRDSTNEPKTTTPTTHTPTAASEKKKRATRARLGDVLSVIAAYRAPDAMPKSHRIAHFLDWYARKAPRLPIPANLIYRAISGIPRTPRMDAPETEAVSSAISSARVIMKAQYRRGIVSERGLGFRATVDDEDTATTQMRNDARRLVSAHRNLDATAAIVDPAKLTAPTRAWVSKGVSPLLKVLNDDNRITRLLPKPEDK